MTEPSLPILLLDNYDSYTYNLHHLIAGACGGAPPLTVRNDTFQSWDELRRALPPFGAVVISPGPGNADKLTDFGVCGEALTSGLPVLGVCLGRCGSSRVKAPAPDAALAFTAAGRRRVQAPGSRAGLRRRGAQGR